ncbi:NmrA-like family domain-containing protein 1 [Ceratobasidium sp. AG-Ba]|nr:NmrA-like family domain-containing protein 1 [Ceratobasidium sp. AG-Ba]
MGLSTEGKPIIAVCGATGFQGGSVVKHILQDGKFAVRALTRKVNGAAAKELSEAGAAVVYADFDSLDSLCLAFKGCYGAYGTTDYFEAFEKELQQGINIIDAAKITNLEHLVFFAAPHTPGLDVKAFKHKAAAGDYLRSSDIPYTIFATSFYYGNIFLFDAITRNRAGGWRLSFPFPTDIPIPSVSPKDIGQYVLAAFKNPSEWLGKDMYVVNEYISLRQYAETFSEITSSNIEICETTQDEFMALQYEPYIIEGWAIFKFFIDEHEAERRLFSPELAQKLCPNRQTWRDFISEHLEVPVPQPLMIKCMLTQDEFQNH